MPNEKDPELSKFASGTRRFDQSPKSTLKEAIAELDRKRRLKPYLRTDKQIEAAKRISDRMMGESDDA